MICFRQLVRIDMFPYTLDINNGVSMHVETIVLLSNKLPDSVINATVEFGEGVGKVTLNEIAERAKKY